MRQIFNSGIRSRRRGFSLLECIVAMSLLGVIGSLVLQWIRSESNHHDFVTKKTRCCIRADNVVAVFQAAPETDVDLLQAIAGDELKVRVENFQATLEQGDRPPTEGMHLSIESDSSDTSVGDSSMRRDCWEWLP
ncbi:MAG: prepilin-type N-terminal cleavage/methylation domain-containing protein [Planctomycetota bacterium]